MKRETGIKNRSTSYYKTYKSLQANQISSTERGSPLPFSFVPKSGILPTKVSMGKDMKLRPQIVTCKKQEMSYKPEGESMTAEESTLKSWCQSSVVRKSSAEEVLPSDFEKAQQNDLFIAEFVLLVDSDEEEERDDKSKSFGGDSRFKQLSVTPEPKVATPYINKLFAPDDQQDEFLHSAEYQDKGPKLLSSVSAVSPIPFMLQYETVKHSTIQSCNRQPRFNLSVKQEHPINNTPINLQEGDIITDTTKDFSIIDSDTLKDTHFTQSHIRHGKTKYPYSSKSPETQTQGGPSLPMSSCQRSNVLSPLSIHIVKYPICCSPSPIQSPYYGSTSTLYSNPPSSYDQGSHVPSRLTFLTSLLRSKKLSHKRPFSPDSIQYYSASNPDQLHSFMKNINPPTISRKSLSCFSLDKPKELKTVQFQKQADMLPSASESNILYSESSFYQRPIRALSPDSMHFKPSKIVYSRQKAGSIPLLHKPSTSPFSSKENISPLHVKPPLSKETYKPLKKYSVLGKSRKVTLSPPVSTYNISNSQSEFDSRKQIESQNKKKSVGSDNHFKTRSYTAKEDSLGMLAVHRPTVTPILSTPILQPTVSIFQKSINDNMNSKIDISSSSHLNYRPYSNSLSPQELPRKYTPKCTASYNDYSPPRTALSRSTDMPSANLLSQCSDHSDNKKSYRIKSNYKAFAAIPTNTLLLDQKAINEPELNEANAGEEKMETHSEMCSPAQLRQQTEEICAAIDEVLHDPLPLHREHGSRSSKTKLAQKISEMAKSPSRIPSAGRETKYASLQQRTATKSSSVTKPGVIRPITLKVCLDEQNQEMYHPYPFDHFTVT